MVEIKGWVGRGSHLKSCSLGEFLNPMICPTLTLINRSVALSLFSLSNRIILCQFYCPIRFPIDIRFWVVIKIHLYWSNLVEVRMKLKRKKKRIGEEWRCKKEMSRTVDEKEIWGLPLAWGPLNMLLAMALFSLNVWMYTRPTYLWNKAWEWFLILGALWIYNDIFKHGHWWPQFLNQVCKCPPYSSNPSHFFP